HRLVHLDQALAVFLETVLHELGIDEQRLALHRAGHQHAVAIKDAAAAAGENLVLMLLPIGFLNRPLAAIGLKEGDSSDQRDQQSADDRHHGARAASRE